MNNWFTVEKIDDKTFALSEYGHYEETHCYLLIGEKYSALIDTGLGVSDIKSVVAELTELPVIVLTTHAHWDHIGGHKFFKNIAVHENEREWLSKKFPLPLSVVKSNLLKFPCDFPNDFKIENYRIFQGEPQIIFRDSDIFDLGNRKIEVIHTPGHSPGHCCFYEMEMRYLYSGDLIYEGKLDCFYPTTDPLSFYNSVKKVSGYDIVKILPGHHKSDISVSMINKVKDAFSSLYKSGKLGNEKGIFSFENFQIHL